MTDDPQFFTARQLAERWQLNDPKTVYGLPIRRVKIGGRVRFPRAAVEQYETRGYELPPAKERSA